MHSASAPEILSEVAVIGPKLVKGSLFCNEKIWGKCTAQVCHCKRPWQSPFLCVSHWSSFICSVFICSISRPSEWSISGVSRSRQKVFEWTLVFGKATSCWERVLFKDLRCSMSKYLFLLLCVLPSGKNKAHTHKLFGPVSLGTTPGSSQGQSRVTCPWGEPGFALSLHSGSPVLSQGQTQFVPWNEPSSGAVEKHMCWSLKVYVPLLAHYATYHWHRNQSEAKQYDFRINYLQNNESESEREIRGEVSMWTCAKDHLSN